MQDAQPDQASDGDLTADQPQDGQNDADDAEKPSEGDSGPQDDGSLPDGLAEGLNPIPESVQKRYNDPSIGDLDPEPKDGIVVEDASDIEIEGEETRRGFVPSKSYYLKIYPMGSQRPTFVLLFRAGIPIPKSKIETMRAAAEARKAKEAKAEAAKTEEETETDESDDSENSDKD